MDADGDCVLWRLLKFAMCELDVANSEPRPSPRDAADAEILEAEGAVTPMIDLGSLSEYPPGELRLSRYCLDGVGSYDDAEDSVRA